MTKRWDYGSAGDRWPVRPGDVWSVGPHVLACGDLEEGDGVRLLDLVGVAPGACYTDPPWNAGNAASFRTKAHGWGGERARRVDFYGSFLPAVAVLLGSVRGPIFMEGGVREAPRVREVLSAQGIAVLASWKITYYRRRPCILHALASHPLPFVPSVMDPSGMDDEETPAYCLGKVCQHGTLVLDPCMGRGLTAVSADAVGARVVGLELHPRRLAVTIDKLAQRGHKPKQTERLH